MSAKPKQPQKSRLVIVSNRLPVVLEQSGKGHWRAEPGSGGLVTAMAPVLKDRGGIWIGWPGTAADQEDDMQLESLLDSVAVGG